MTEYCFLMNFAAGWCLVPEGLSDAADTGNKLLFFPELKSEAGFMCPEIPVLCSTKADHSTCNPESFIFLGSLLRSALGGLGAKVPKVSAATRIGIKKITIL